MRPPVREYISRCFGGHRTIEDRKEKETHWSYKTKGKIQALLIGYGPKNIVPQIVRITEPERALSHSSFRSRSVRILVLRVWYPASACIQSYYLTSWYFVHNSESYLILSIVSWLTLISKYFSSPLHFHPCPNSSPIIPPDPLLRGPWYFGISISQ